MTVYGRWSGVSAADYGTLALSLAVCSYVVIVGCSSSGGLVRDVVSLPCQHHFCRDCLEQHCLSGTGAGCPVKDCAAPFWNKDVRPNCQMRNIVSAVQAIRRRIQQEHPFDFTQVDKVRLEHKKIMETVQMEDFLPGEQMGNIAQLMEKATGIVAEFRRDTADLNSANQDLERSKFNGEIVIVATGCSSSQNVRIKTHHDSCRTNFEPRFPHEFRR